ncbi:MAG TPA: hypothetical protein VF939_10865 [Puia sp.]
MRMFTLALALFITLSSTGMEIHPQSPASPNIYRDHSGQNYRLLKKAHYMILDTAHFYLYSYNKLVQGEKIARPTTCYYFSQDAASPIMPLTIANLEKVFAGDAAFCYKLHTDFKSDKDLISWYPSLKTYKIKYAYGQSSK